MKKLSTMRAALADAALLGDALPGESWRPWRVLLTAAMGEVLDDDERVIFTKLTGRPREPLEMVECLAVIAGRRSGKSRAMATLSTYLATLVDWSDSLFLGKRGLCLYLAPTTKQASVAFGYAAALVEHVDLLREAVENRTADVLTLRRSIDLTVQAANWRYSRGSTCVAVCLDECAYFHSGEESANSDEELMVALQPSLSTTSGPMLIASSPATMTGVIYKLWKRHYGPEGDPKILIAQSDSRTLNPSLRESVVARAYAADPAAAAAEYGGSFREPLTAYLERPLVERAIEPGISLRMRLPGVQYVCFVDCASGTGTDSFAAAIGHKGRDKDRDVIVIDALLEAVPPFDPFAITAWVAGHLRQWGIREVSGDNWAGGFPVSAFARNGIGYMTSPLSASELYLHALPCFTSGTVAMLDQPRAVEQLVGLRRKIGQGGRESISHQRGARDDLANVICGVCWRLTPVEMAASGAYPMLITRDSLNEPVLVEGQRSIHGPGAPLKGPMEPWRPFVGGRGAGWRRFDHPGY
jgi:hypothetical protein